MGFWGFLSRSRQPISYFTPNVTYLGGPDELAEMIGSLTPAEMWRTQPHLRTVVSFLARNMAHPGLHTFERVGEDRRRDRNSAFAATWRRPNADQTSYELMYALVGDLGLYDRAYWLVTKDADAVSGWTLRRLPPTWVTPVARDVFGAKSYVVTRADSGGSVEVPAESVLAFTGYHPTNPAKGSPTVETLKDTLKEQIEAARYRGQVWKRGGRVSAVLERPKDAPQWSDAAREAFREDWYAKYTGNGPKAGGTPLLEDGMQLKRVDFSASEQQFVEAAKLSFATVASAFHVNPTMVGILDNANYSNVREFRRMLYGDTLGPLIAQIEDRINTFLLPRLGMDSATHYVEFNIAEKLQGSFEEQAQVMQTLVGAPLFTRNEGRAIFNRPAIDGGDQLVTPLNVLIGGQASPTDSGSQNLAPSRPPMLKSAAPDSHVAQVSSVLSRFFKRQGDAVLKRLRAGADWWDGERWDRELADDLTRVSTTLAGLVGAAEAERLGYPDRYDADRTLDFLRAVAARQAGTVNATTKAQLDDAVEDADAEHVFSVAQEARAPGVGAKVATFVAAFATVEAARHIASAEGVKPRKTWVTGANPRSSHAAMNGETVGIDEPFSNGMQWPGESGSVDEVAGCNCSVSVAIP